MKGVVHGEDEGEEDEVGERLAHLEGRRRLAGRAGLEKLFWMEGGVTEGSSSSWRETAERTFRITALLCLQTSGHTQILNILSRVPSAVLLSPGKITGIFQTGTLNTSARSCEKVTQVALIDFSPEKSI